MLQLPQKVAPHLRGSTRILPIFSLAVARNLECCHFSLSLFLHPHSLCADPRTSADPGQEAGRCLVRAAGCGSERADLGKHRMLVGLREQPRAAGLAPVSWEQPRWCRRAGPGACTDSQLLSADFRAAVPSGPWFSHSSNDPTAS